MSYYIIYPISYLIGLLPYKVQFLFADIIRWLLHRVVKYRLGVVRDNLLLSFPEKSQAELRDIEDRFYKHLSDVFLESMSIASVSRDSIMRRMHYTNSDEMENLTQGRSWICAMAHYGSWEYTTNYSLFTHHDDVLAVYRPLRDPGFDRFYRKVRSRFGVKPVAMKDIVREMLHRQKSGSYVSVALIADQTPPGREIQNWTNFLGRMTPFFMGMEKMALKFRMPIAFLNVTKTARGYYEGHFEIIYDGNEQLPEGEITRRYAMHLEQMIRRRPELWMWSHKRWKHRYDPIKHGPLTPNLNKQQEESAQ